MHKYYLFLFGFLSITLLSCSNSAETKNKKGLSEPVNAFKKFRASGNEPGWNLEITNSLTELLYNIDLDYGAIQFSGKAVSISNNAQEIIEFKLNKGGDIISIPIKVAACTDDAGFNHDLDIHFSYNDRAYIGCGDFDKERIEESDGHLIKRVDHFICFDNDEKISPKVWVSFNERSFALQVKYKGQSEAIDLRFTNEEFIEGGAHPTIVKYYDEVLQGKVNGSYKISHSGVWDYVLYTRSQDGKQFNFTIDHNANPYSKTPCF